MKSFPFCKIAKEVKVNRTDYEWIEIDFSAVSLRVSIDLNNSFFDKSSLTRAMLSSDVSQIQTT